MLLFFRKEGLACYRYMQVQVAGRVSLKVVWYNTKITKITKKKNFMKSQPVSNRGANDAGGKRPKLNLVGLVSLVLKPSFIPGAKASIGAEG